MDFGPKEISKCQHFLLTLYFLAILKGGMQNIIHYGLPYDVSQKDKQNVSLPSLCF
jgi:hypothetical protein